MLFRERVMKRLNDYTDFALKVRGMQ